MMIFNQFHLLMLGILVVYLFSLVNSIGLSVRISPKTFTQYRDQDVVFYCYVTGNPAPIVSWYTNGQDITHDSRLKMTNVSGGYLMRLGPLHPYLDNGTLECRGNNAVDTPVTDKAELHVLSSRFQILDPNLPPGIPKPTLARYNPNPKVYVGTSLTLIVNVSGNPFPKITWFKDKKLLGWNNPRFKLLKNDSLRITNAQIADKGTYDYMAENDKGQIFPRSWVLLVDYIKMKPGFQPGLKNQVVDPETNVVFNCSTTGHPAPYVYWEDSKHRRVNDDAILVITNVRKSETYTCFAKNELGNASISVNLTLSGLPFPPSNVIVKSKTGHTLTLSWQDGEAGVKIDYHNINYRKRGDPNWKTVYNIVGSSRERVLDELDPYSFYEVQVFAVNNVGTSKGSQIVVIRTEETAPGSAPRVVVVKSTESGSFEITWKPPEYPNGIILGYTIYYSDEPQKSWERWQSTHSTKSPLKVSSLILKDHRYAVRISSFTGSGAGPLSEPFLVQTLQGAPSNPRNVQTNVISSTEVKVSWEKPSYEGSGQGIVGYDIFYNTSLEGGRKQVPIQSPDDLSKVVTGLRPATVYQFDVVARTDDGSGPLSFPKFATTWEGAPSAPPTNVSCTAVDESSIHCSWQPPPRKDRNGRIIGYTVRYKAANSNAFVTKAVDASVLSMNLEKLQAYTEYRIDVAAKSSKGQGPFSHHLKITTDETVPSKPPENMTATAINSTAIIVTWKPPSPPFGAKLTGYLFYFRRIPQDGEYTELSIGRNTRRKLLTKLEPKQEYKFTIAAKSVKGNGRFADFVVCKTKQAPPQPPILASKKLAAPQVGVTLRWKSNARAIEQFQLRYAKEVEKITNETLLMKLPYVVTTFTSSVKAYNATNLDYGLWYVFKISVKNVDGWSKEREAWLLMDSAKPTGPPLNFRVETKTSTSMQLSWDLPEKWKRNGKIIGYQLSYIQIGFPDRKKTQNLGDSRMFELKGLKKFTSYHFWILAKTEAGNGPVVMIKEKTMEDAPSNAPTLIEAKGMGTKVVRLKFIPPSTPNGNITGYKANIFLNDPVYAQVWKEYEIKENRNQMYVGDLPSKSDPTFWFTVAARTSIGYGPFSEPKSAQTLDHDLPLPVESLSVDVSSSRTVKLRWSRPVDTSAVTNYKILYRGEKKFVGADKKIQNILLPEEIKTITCCKLESASLENLEPNTKYTISIVSVDKLDTMSDPIELKIKTKVGSSPVFRQPNISTHDITDKYIPIYVYPASERHGPVSHYLIRVASLGKTLSEARNKLKDITSSRTRRAVETDNDVYIAGKLNADAVPTTFKVGQGQIESGYTNKPLTLGHFYAFSVQSCVLDENAICLETSTTFTNPVEFSVLKPARTSGAGNEDVGNNLWLLGPVFAVVLLIIIISAICFLWRRRSRRREGKPKSLKVSVHDEQLPMMTPRDPVELQRLNLETEGMREHPPVPISELDVHIGKLRSNNNNSFTREYESIDPGMTFISDTSAHHLNQSKNRYPNIVPYDHTRVVIQDTNGFLDSDYINANYMAGYRKPNAYIATQAPLTNTINDFWQMIWEQDTRTIVMMTNLQEKGRIKCDQYWPNQSSEKFGNISVVVIETLELAHYTVRTFRLCKDGQSDKSREVKQFQYTAWPDHGVPNYSTSLLCFIRKVRLANPSDVGPVVVHCSAGVGRTGVFIVIDSMLERIRREQTVDVYGHVTLLRSQRNHMVQTEEQYIFIHETLLETVLFGNTEIHASDLSQYYKKLNEIGENETTSIEEHFKQLGVSSHTHRFSTAILAVNKSKNRHPKILPYEHSRVDLVPIRSVDGSNYINASYIDGYKHRRTYIAAQAPLEETVNDFWRMIMEKKSNIIVMLSGTDENDEEMTAKYWPAEQSAKYHFYIVDPVSVEETPNFTLRQFKVNDMMSSCPSLVKLFQLRKWPDRGKPQSYKAILDLIGQVHTARNNDETRGPVVVHCSTGSARTGVFCALSIVLERMRAEGVVDLLQTVRQLREQRPQMVDTLEEYAFCYEAALQYLSSFDHITA